MSKHQGLHAKGEPSPKDPPLIADEAGGKPRTPRILVAFEARSTLRMLEQVFQQAGYQVTSAVDGQEALESVRSEKPDLIVLDTLLSPIDGFETVKSLREDATTAEMPILLIRSDGEADFTDFCRKCFVGADCLLSAPFNPLEVITFARRVFNSISPPPHGENPV